MGQFHPVNELRLHGKSFSFPSAKFTQPFFYFITFSFQVHRFQYVFTSCPHDSSFHLLNLRPLGKDALRSVSETQVLCVALCLHVNQPSSSSSFRPNASSAASAMTTLIGRLTGLRPTPYKSTTSPTTCECSNTQNHQTQLSIVSIFHNCHVLPCAGSSWCTWLTRTRLSTRVRYVSENISAFQLLLCYV